MIFGRIWSEKEASIFMADLSIDDRATQEDQRGHRVGKCVMPTKGRKGSAKIVLQAEVADELTKRKGIFFRPDCSRNFESIYPWSKAMKGKGAQEPSLGSRAMGDEPAIAQEVVDLGPELGQARRASKIVWTNAVNLLRCPGDRLLREKKATEIFGDLEVMHQRNANLHGNFGASPANAGALKIDGCERSLGDGHAARSTAARRSLAAAYSATLKSP
jgi:hypothetical protein